MNEDCTCDYGEENLLDPACPVHGVDSVEPLDPEMTVDEAEAYERRRQEAAIRAANANQGFEPSDEEEFFETGRLVILEGTIGQGPGAHIAYRISSMGLSEASVMAATELVHDIAKDELLGHTE